MLSTTKNVQIEKEILDFACQKSYEIASIMLVLKVSGHFIQLI